MSLHHDSDLATRFPAQPTSFVGRERELASILEALQETAVQLITLTGPGGVGKTRLSEQIALEVHAVTGFESVWISLAPLETTEHVALAIAQQFGLRGIGPATLPDRLASTLLGRPVLIVMDNFEHLLAAAPMVAELLEACPTMKVLATSRGPLNLTWEHEVAIDPLPLPPMHATLPEIESNPAVRLFLDRTSFVEHGRAVALEELQTIGEICRKLDGLPLAIELAAPWRRLLTAEELLIRLDRPLALLSGGPADAPVRLQSMSSAVDWSYALLEPEARRLFRQLSIFPEAFSIEAVEFLAATMHVEQAIGDQAGTGGRAETVLSSLASLVNQGVVRRVGPHGFRMLQTVREYGLGLLAEQGELERCGWAHLGWCVSLAVEPVFDPLDGYLWGPTGHSGDQADLTAALAFALDHGEFDSALRLAVTLSPIWAEQGRYGEARAALQRIRDGLGPSASEIRAILLGWTAEWAWLQGDYTATGELAQTSLEVSVELGMPRAIAANHYRLGRVATLRDPGTAAPLLMEALESFRALGEPRNTCWCLVGLGHAALGVGDSRAAQAWLDEAESHREHVDVDAGAWLTLALKLGLARLALHVAETARAKAILADTLELSRAERNRYFESLCYSFLCDVLRIERSYALAVEAGRQGLQIAQSLGHRYRERQCLIQLARVARDAGKLEQALLFDGGVARLRSQLDFGVADLSLLTELSNSVHVPHKRLAAIQETGHSLTGSELLAQVIALELELKQVKHGSSVLSNREAEVLRLLAHGATNGEIADRLFVSRRTVDTHVGSILRKLQVASRHEAVRSARQQGMVDPEDVDS